MKCDNVKQGESYTNSFPVDDSFLDITTNDKLSNYTCNLDAKQYPDDTASISRAITINSDGVFEFTLTPAETAALDPGLWYLIGTLTKTGYEYEQTIRINIQKNWV